MRCPHGAFALPEPKQPPKKAKKLSLEERGKHEKQDEITLCWRRAVSTVLVILFRLYSTECPPGTGVGVMPFDVTAILQVISAVCRPSGASRHEKTYPAPGFEGVRQKGRQLDAPPRVSLFWALSVPSRR